MAEPILEIEGLATEFDTPRGAVRVLEGVTLSLAAGDVVGVVGEAGAGKSVLVRSVLRLLPETGRVAAGSVRFKGRDLRGLGDGDLKALRATEIAHILPDAKAQLNPLVRVGEMMVAVMRAHAEVGKAEARERAVALLTTVGIVDPARRLDAYPHELSGGMAQRICIALALMHTPSLIVADEPTHGLDVTVQRQVLDLMAGLVREREAAQLVVTRDLGIVAQYCQAVAVMHGGRIVEAGSTLELFEAPRNPYTRQLLASVSAERRGRSVRSVATR